MSRLGTADNEIILSGIFDTAQNRGTSDKGKKISNTANGDNNQQNKIYMLPKKQARQVKIYVLPVWGNKFFPETTEVKKENVNAVKPYTQNKFIDTVIAQERREDAIIKSPKPVNPPRGESAPQK